MSGCAASCKLEPELQRLVLCIEPLALGLGDAQLGVELGTIGHHAGSLQGELPLVLGRCGCWRL